MNLVEDYFSNASSETIYIDQHCKLNNSQSSSKQNFSIADKVESIFSRNNTHTNREVSVNKALPEKENNYIDNNTLNSLLSNYKNEGIGLANSQGLCSDRNVGNSKIESDSNDLIGKDKVFTLKKMSEGKQSSDFEDEISNEVEVEDFDVYKNENENEKDIEDDDDSMQTPAEVSEITPEGEEAPGNNLEEGIIANKKKVTYIANKTNKYKKIKSVSIKQRFQTLFAKVRVILLFRYMMKRVKFYGLNIIKSDIKMELEKFDQQNVIFTTPVKVIQRASTQFNQNLMKQTYLSNANNNSFNKTFTEKLNHSVNCKVPLHKRQRIWFKKIGKMLIIHPDKSFMSLWKFIMLICALYTVTVMPYFVSFYHLPSPYSCFFLISTLIDLLYAIDFGINCILGYYDDKNELVLSWRKIVRNYIQTWMLVDMISIIPFQYIPLDTVNNSPYIIDTYRRLLRLFQLVRVIRLYHLISNSTYVKKLSKILKLKGSMKRIISALLCLILGAHVFACVWYLIASTSNCDIDTWVSRVGLRDAEIGFLYITSLYFSLSVISTVGYGDITPYTNIEKIIVISWEMLGAFSVSFLMSNFVAVLSNYDTKTLNIQEKIRILNKFSTRVKLRNETYLRIKKSFDENNVNTMFDGREEILKDLPHYLRMEVILQIYQKNIEDIFYFRDRCNNFIVDLILVWKSFFFKKDEFIYFSNEKAEDVYFIIKGNAIYIDDEGNIITKFSRGAILGEIEIILSLKIRFLNLQSVDNISEINVISGEEFRNIIIRYSSEFISTLKMSKKKYFKYNENIQQFKSKGIVNEGLKSKLNMFKTTLTYLRLINHVREVEKEKNAVPCEVISEVASLEKEPQLNLSCICNKINNENNNSFLNNNDCNSSLCKNESNIVNRKKPRSSARRVSFSRNLDQYSGSAHVETTHNNPNQVSSGIMSTVLQNPGKHYEKLKLKEIVSMFDTYIQFLVKLNMTFCSLKAEVNELTQISKDNKKENEAAMAKIKKIEQKQAVIEAKFNNKFR